MDSDRGEGGRRTPEIARHVRTRWQSRRPESRQRSSRGERASNRAKALIAEIPRQRNVGVKAGARAAWAGPNAGRN
eukprot:4071088-Heterocapsa_arctica.AAC.1